MVCVSVFRVSSPPGNVAVDLANRGLDPEAIAFVMSELPTEITDSTSLEVLINYPFNSFSEGRFGDGSYGVFYSALEEDTAVAEKEYHASRGASADGLARSFVLLQCTFEGRVEDVTRQAALRPYLISDNGYAGCRQLALRAIARGVDCLFAPSARRPDGVCSPVFSRETLTNPLLLRNVVLRQQDGDWVLV